MAAPLFLPDRVARAAASGDVNEVMTALPSDNCF
jgi:hypothetical protein